MAQEIGSRESIRGLKNSPRDKGGHWQISSMQSIILVSDLVRLARRNLWIALNCACGSIAVVVLLHLSYHTMADDDSMIDDLSTVIFSKDTSKVMIYIKYRTRCTFNFCLQLSSSTILFPRPCHSRDPHDWTVHCETPNMRDSIDVSNGEKME